MAGTTRTNVAQTAFNNATQAVVALIANGQIEKVAVSTAIKGIAGELLTALEAVRKGDEDNTKQLNYQPRYGGGKGGGGNQNPATIKFKGTKFADKSIEEVYKMGAAEASANHGYNDQNGNPQAGANFVTWLATKDGFMAGKCKAYLEQLPSGNSGTPADSGAASGPAEGVSTTATGPTEAAPQTDQEFSFGSGDW